MKSWSVDVMLLLVTKEVPAAAAARMPSLICCLRSCCCRCNYIIYFRTAVQTPNKSANALSIMFNSVRLACALAGAKW